MRVTETIESLLYIHVNFKPSKFNELGSFVKKDDSVTQASSTGSQCVEELYIVYEMHIRTQGKYTKRRQICINVSELFI